MPTWAVGSSKNELDWRAMANGAVPERWSLPTRETGGFFWFEKNDRANISAHELEALQDLAQDLLARKGVQLNLAVQESALEEICHVH
jgi:hypothetical protein